MRMHNGGVGAVEAVASVVIVACIVYGLLLVAALPFRKRMPRPPAPPRQPSLSQKVAAELARFEERKRIIASLPLSPEEIEAAVEEETALLGVRVKELLDE